MAAAPVLLDVDLDFWGGAAGPQLPAWEASGLRACGDYLRACGSAAWGDMRALSPSGRRACPTAELWPSLLGADSAAAPSPSAAAANGSKLGLCALALRAAARVRPPVERQRLRRAHALGLSPAEAMLAAAPAGAGAAACGRVDERRLAAWLRPVRPRLVTVARSIDGFMPFYCAEILEAAVLRAVRAAANASALAVTYLPGTASAEALRAMRR